jgi:hypothetical protein
MDEPLRMLPGMRATSEEVRAIAAGQQGIVTREQLLAAGVSSSAIARALCSCVLRSIHNGVDSALPPGLLTEEGHLVAALLAAGEGALRSPGTAAWRWRLIPAPPTVITLAVPRGRAVEGVQLHVSGRLRPGDTASNGRFPTTSVPRTLLDLGTRYEHRGAHPRARRG